MSIQFSEALASRSNNFDFLRFSAALAVILSHSFDLTGNYAEEPLRMFSNGDSSIGEIAVAIFFITSGYLITQSYNRTQSLSKYFYARCLRIYPALIVVILATVFIIGPLLTSVNLKEYFVNVQTVKYLFNITSIKISFHLPGVFDSNPFPRDAVNGSLWSLPYELLCYILVAVVGTFKKGNYLVLFGLLGLAAMFLPFMMAVKLFSYSFYFLCGALFYINRFKVQMNAWICIILIIVFVINIGYNPSNALKTLVNGFSLSYVVLYISALKIPSLANFSRYGDFSYGLYVWAFPVQQIIALKYSDSNSSNFFVSAVITLCIAYLSWHLVEKRALRLKNQSVGRLQYSVTKNVCAAQTYEKVE